VVVRVEKIFKYLLALALVEVIATGLIVFYFVKIGLAQTIGIGVAPSLVKFNSPGTYLYEFCFFNQGDTDAEYETVNGEVIVQYQRFIVPAGTNFTNCVKKQLLLTVTQPGYFYITAKPANQTQQAGAVSIVRRVGIKVELANYQPTQTTTTTITQTTSGGGAGNIQQTTTTTIRNQTTQTTIKTTTTTNKEVEHIVEVLNRTKNATNIQTTQNPSSPSFGIIDILKIALMIGVIVGVIYLIVYIIQIV
jgi:hypothetical protein